MSDRRNTGEWDTRPTQLERRTRSGRKLLAAAVELIAERGWDGATAAEIGRRAGFSRAMVHSRYGSKEALIDTLLITEYEQRVTSDHGASSGLERVLMPLQQLVEIGTEDPQFLESVFVISFTAVNRQTPLRPRIQHWMEQIARGLENSLQAGIDDRSVRPDVDIANAAHDIVASGVGVAYGWIVMPDRFHLVTEYTRLLARIRADYGR